MNGQTSKIIDHDLIEPKNSVPNTFGAVEIAGALFLENSQVLGLGSNINGDWIMGDLAGPDELILDSDTLAGVGGSAIQSDGLHRSADICRVLVGTRRLIRSRRLST